MKHFRTSTGHKVCEQNNRVLARYRATRQNNGEVKRYKGKMAYKKKKNNATHIGCIRKSLTE